MNAKNITLALALAAFVSGNAAFAQSVQYSYQVAGTGCPATVSQSAVIATPCATSCAPLVLSQAAVVCATESGKAAVSLDLLGMRLFGFGLVPRRLDMR